MSLMLVGGLVKLISMAKSSGNWDAIVIGIASILIGLFAMAFTQSIFNLFFVAIVVAVLWNYTDKTNKLESRILWLEAKSGQTAG